jgi:hypothetical protein
MSSPTVFRMVLIMALGSGSIQNWMRLLCVDMARVKQQI